MRADEFGVDACQDWLLISCGIQIERAKFNPNLNVCRLFRGETEQQCNAPIMQVHNERSAPKLAATNSAKKNRVDRSQKGAHIADSPLPCKSVSTCIERVLIQKRGSQMASMITEALPISSPTQSNHQRPRPFNARPHCQLPMTGAYAKLLDEKVPGDLRSRTYLGLITEVLFHRAFKGDVRAAKEITEAIEGRVSRTRPLERTGPPEIKIIRPDGKLMGQKQEIHSVPLKGKHIESA
jgi:hypothetical protein